MNVADFGHECRAAVFENLNTQEGPSWHARISSTTLSMVEQGASETLAKNCGQEYLWRLKGDTLRADR